MILLDSDVLIDLLRKYPPAVEWFDALDDEQELVVSALGVSLYTFNQRHYSFIAGVQTSQPYTKYD